MDKIQVPQSKKGKMTGVIGIVLSILSFFTMPFILGISGFFTGFIASKRGAVRLGRWSMVLSSFVVVLTLLLNPFF